MKRAHAAAPTRLSLLRTRRRLARVREGRDLLRKKREALVRELLKHARPAMDARERIGRCADDAYPRLLDALTAEGGRGVRSTAQPLRDITVSTTTSRAWGLTLASVDEVPPLTRTVEARGTAPGATPVPTVEAAREFERLVELLLDAAPREMLLRELGWAVARTSRQVRALELRVEPELVATAARIGALLEEREREDHLRLRHFLRRKVERPEPHDAARPQGASVNAITKGQMPTGTRSSTE